MFKALCVEAAQDIVAWRRMFHQYPELSFHEANTARLVADVLKDCGLRIQEGVNGHGVIGELAGSSEGPTIAFRADMDALPIQEETKPMISILIKFRVLRVWHRKDQRQPFLTLAERNYMFSILAN
jgi:metal-dependent amidase/aminoacylase/carboxypeptidase family protein